MPLQRPVKKLKNRDLEYLKFGQLPIVVANSLLLCKSYSPDIGG